ncbi:MAG: bifunctional riboflavin kinase/FAD synthetase [Anaerolineales bacterium]|jgi:riboflavin kinase/FMN adenylyltransferase
MPVYHRIEEVQFHGAHLAVGSFDGVHRGHQRLVEAMVHQAHANREPAVVLTFHPHPSVVLGRRSKPSYLSAPEERAQWLGALGVDSVILQPFTLELSRVRAAEFLDRLVRHLGLRSLWAGPDFALGHNREGNLQFLKEYGVQAGFQVHTVAPLEYGAEVISSTRIRRYLSQGDVISAAACLGRPYRLTGQVTEGAHRGVGLGIPTANLDAPEERAIPARGVYATWVWVQGQRHPGVTNIGIRPTFEENANLTIEAHLLDFQSDLYGKELRLDFMARIRDEQKFSGPKELLGQIQRDVATARARLRESSSASPQPD